MKLGNRYGIFCLIVFLFFISSCTRHKSVSMDGGAASVRVDSDYHYVINVSSK